jgi:hypothetical protein
LTESPALCDRSSLPLGQEYRVQIPERSLEAQSPNALSTNSLPTGSEFTLQELRRLAERGNQAATIAGCILVLQISAFSTVGSLALSWLGGTSTLIAASGCVTLFAATMYSGVRIGSRLIDWIDRCLMPGRLLTEARNSGGACQNCEYSLKGLTIPRCPECGAQVELLRSECAVE